MAHAISIDKAGFIGTGRIGTPMAQRLLGGGVALVVHDIREEAMRPLVDLGAVAASSPREVGDLCEVVFVSPPTIDALREVALGSSGLVHGGRIKVLVNTGTVGQPFTQTLDAELSAKGITLVDCPISGGPAGAVAGKLSVMVSGDPAVVEALRPLLAHWGHSITVAGDKAGVAQVLKLANNMLSAVYLAASAEVFVMGTKAGLDPEVMLAAINAGSGRSSVTEEKIPRTVLTRTFKHGSALHITGKDVDLAIALGDELGVPQWVCQAARLVYKHAIFAGGGDEDVMSIVRNVERVAGFEIPKTR